MTPLRWVPFRIVCVLGLDQEFMSSPAADAADLVAESPQLGDPDPRAESRQSLLEIVLAAREHLIVVRDGHDVRSSHELPRVVPAAELFDAVVALAAPDQRDDLRGRLEVIASPPPLRRALCDRRTDSCRAPCGASTAPTPKGRAPDATRPTPPR